MHKKIWTSNVIAEKLEGKRVILVVNGEAVLLTSDGETTKTEEIPSLSSSHDKTDRHVVQYVTYGEDNGYDSITVRTPDSDLFFTLLYYAGTWKKLKELIYDMGTGLNRRRTDILKIARKLGQKMCTALLGIYVFTGEDCNSAFKGKGKVKALKILDKNTEYLDTFSEIGEQWEVSTEVSQSLQKFTCALYGFPSMSR